MNDEVEDAVQDVFVECFRDEGALTKVNPDEPNSSFRKYLYVLVRNIARRVEDKRIRLEWISAAEGQKFAKVMRELEDAVAAVTTKEIEFTKKVLTEEEMKKRKRKVKGTVEVTG